MAGIADGAEYLGAIHQGQTEIKDKQIEGVVTERTYRTPAIGYMLDGIVRSL